MHRTVLHRSPSDRSPNSDGLGHFATIICRVGFPEYRTSWRLWRPEPVLCRAVPGWLPAPGFVAAKIRVAAGLAVLPGLATAPRWPALDPHRGFAISHRGADLAPARYFSPSPARARPARVQAMAENSTVVVALALGCCRPQAVARSRLREHRAGVAMTGLGSEESPVIDRSAEWQWLVVAYSAAAVGSAQCRCRTQKAASPGLPTDWARMRLARSPRASAASPVPGRFAAWRTLEVVHSATAVERRMRGPSPFVMPAGSPDRTGSARCRRGPPPAAPVPS